MKIIVLTQLILFLTLMLFIRYETDRLSVIVDGQILDISENSFKLGCYEGVDTKDCKKRANSYRKELAKAVGFKDDRQD